MSFEIERVTLSVSWPGDISVSGMKLAKQVQLITNENIGGPVHCPRIRTMFKGQQQLLTFQYIYLPFYFLLAFLKNKYKIMST